LVVPSAAGWVMLSVTQPNNRGLQQGEENDLAL